MEEIIDCANLEQRVIEYVSKYDRIRQKKKVKSNDKLFGKRERDDGLSLKQRIKQVKILKIERGI